MSVKCDEIVRLLRSMRSKKNVRGMARFGINPENNLGISVTALRKIAKEIIQERGRDHELALRLWDTGIRDARLLATIIDDPEQVTEEQLESWVLDIDSWDICDGCCGNLFDRTKFAYSKAVDWTGRDEEFVKRAGFVIQAWLAVHDKNAPDEAFERFFALIKREAHDERTYVKKAVNWALRSIGKRNMALNSKANAAAEELAGMESKAARWIGKDALRELKSEKVRKRLERKRKLP